MAEEDAARRGGALDGLLVLDFSTLLPGPMATLLLAEAGAEVVKIERPGIGDEMREYPPRWGRDSANFALLNRGKRSLAIDLKDPSARERLMPLLERADVLVEQFRPGVMARLGLDYETLRDLNPKLIYCAITGYGQTGPMRDVAGHDLNYMARSGLLSLSMGDPAWPTVPPALVADIAGGAYPAVMNILLALQQRARTGRGQFLDVAMTDGLFPFAFWGLGTGWATGAWPGDGNHLLSGGTARYHLYPTRDGKVLAAAPLEERFWRIFCEIVGLDAPLRDEADTAATLAAVRDIIAGEDAATWEARFAGRDCCCAIVRSLEEAVDDPHFRARGLFGEGPRPVLPVPLAPDLRRAPQNLAPAPALGADTEALLAPSSPSPGRPRNP